MGHIRRISTKGMNRQEWLRLRRLSIGGSDAASIIGLNRWASPFSVWAEKTGRTPEKLDNEAMRQGRDLEEYVAFRFCEETGKRVRRVKAVLYNPRYPAAHADIDRWIVGENAGLECKTTSTLRLRQFQNGEYPPSYYVQCMHYMAVTGADCWYLAVLVMGQAFHTFRIERDEKEIAALMEREEFFWNHYVRLDTPPPADGSEATMETLQSVYAASEDGLMDLFGRDRLFEEYFRQKEARDEAGRRMNAVRQKLMLELGSCEAGICGGYTVSWKPQVRKSFDWKRFSRDHPDMDISAYLKETNARQLYIKGGNENE